VTASFAALGTDNVNPEVETLLDVLGVANHVHVEDAICVKLVNDGFRRNTDSRYEEFGARVNNDVHELIELAFRIVIAKRILEQVAS
jgi:hypothetical protein